MSTHPDHDPLSGLAPPPNDLAAEQATLGAMLQSAEIAQQLAAQLRPDDFYRPANAIVFEAITRLLGKGEPADAVTVGRELMSAGDLGRVGGGPYLHTLVSSVPVVASASAYARAVVQHAQSRDLLAATDRVRQAIYGGADYSDVRDLAEREVFAATRDRAQAARAGLRHRSEFLPGVLETIEARARGEQRGVPTGFLDLDALTNGWQRGQLITIAARPAMGKTALGGACAEAAARAGHPVAVFSMEMTSDELLMRSLSTLGRVPLTNLTHGHMSEPEWEALARAQTPVYDRPVYLDDSPNLTVGQMLTRARRLAASRAGLGLVVVDYLQLARGLAAENRQTEVADISRSLKGMAKELDIPVIALAQLNRGPESRTDKRPLLSDLRESGQIEQDSDVVILIHRDDVYNPESDRPGEADLIVAKHRNGPTTTVVLAATLTYATFRDMAAEQGPPR